jgi:HAD superfamily hydrolase (TIGR01490 family)
MKKIGAFFDIDGTLYREGMITAIFKKFITSDIIGAERWFNEVKEKYDRWDKRIGNYDDYLLKMAEIYVEEIKGIHKHQVEFIAKKVIQDNGDRVYTFTRDRINWHKQMGHIVVTISGSPIELVNEMALKYGFDDWIGTKYFTDEKGFFTGKIKPMWDSESKEKAINKFVKKYNIDLTKSYAYGDTAGDYSMLSMVGNPTAVNPTRELLTKLSQDNKVKKKSRVAVERKDMVYEFDLEYIIK